MERVRIVILVLIQMEIPVYLVVVCNVYLALLTLIVHFVQTDSIFPMDIVYLALHLVYLVLRIVLALNVMLDMESLFQEVVNCVVQLPPIVLNVILHVQNATLDLLILAVVVLLVLLVVQVVT